jgi:hypothetical protein
MSTGDNLAEPMVAATLRAEANDEKATVAAALQNVPRESLAETRLDQAMSNGLDDPEWPSPTFEELATLRRVAHNIPLKLLSIAFVELCERFSYYGVTVVCKSTIPPQPPSNRKLTVEQSRTLSTRSYLLVPPPVLISNSPVLWDWARGRPLASPPSTSSGSSPCLFSVPMLPTSTGDATRPSVSLWVLI